MYSLDYFFFNENVIFLQYTLNIFRIYVIRDKIIYFYLQYMISIYRCNFL